ncbi:MAG: InlB B-repeat-containing protein [Clostridia bacterium]|nr:InlB B-repeat-containing protein [Clostridia bacterium]
MKKLGNKILNILLIVAVVSLVASLASVFSKKSEKKETAEQTYEYTISYRMVLDGELEEIPEAMYKPGGSYPKGYSSDESVKIDRLQSGVISKNEDLEFYGWYLDDDCTLKFSGTIEKGQSGNLILYAKCGIAMWTDFY